MINSQAFTLKPVFVFFTLNLIKVEHSLYKNLLLKSGDKYFISSSLWHSSPILLLQGSSDTPPPHTPPSCHLHTVVYRSAQSICVSQQVRRTNYSSRASLSAATEGMCRESTPKREQNSPEADFFFLFCWQELSCCKHNKLCTPPHGFPDTHTFFEASSCWTFCALLCVKGI